MEKKLLLLCFPFLISATLWAQVTANQVDDFQDGSTEDWFEASGSYSNISTGGPNGTNDNYLQDTATGTGGPGSRMVIRNINQWTGSYTSEGIIAIRMNVRAVDSDMNVRVSITGAGGKFSSSSSTLVTAGSGWTNVEIPISAGDLVAVSDGMDGVPGTDATLTLSSATEIRILSSDIPAWRGAIVDGEMHLDNIEAATSLSVTDVSNISSFNIYPNPGKIEMNIALNSQTSDARIEVYNVLGKRILVRELESLNAAIDVSQWSSGVYLVKVSSANGTQTKRFVKD